MINSSFPLPFILQNKLYKIQNKETKALFQIKKIKSVASLYDTWRHNPLLCRHLLRVPLSVSLLFARANHLFIRKGDTRGLKDMWNKWDELLKLLTWKCLAAFFHVCLLPNANIVWSEWSEITASKSQIW